MRKKCPHCEKEKDVSCFYVTGKRVMSWCKECFNKHVNEKRRENPQINKDRYSKSKEKIKEVARNWYAENKERVRGNIKAWRDKNRDKKYLYDFNRRAKSKTKDSITIPEWKEMLRLCENKCLCCGEIKKLTKDHVIPLSMGGGNDKNNIQPLCINCNSRKGIKTTDYRGKHA